MKIVEHILKNNDREQAYFDLVKFYLNTNDDNREMIRKNWDFNVGWIYPNQSKLLYRIEEKYKPEEKIIASLCYYSISSNNCGDDRDITLALAVIYNSILFNSQDPTEIFNKVANISDQEFSKVLRDFLLREEKDKTMDAFLLKTKNNKYGEIEIVFPWC